MTPQDIPVFTSEEIEALVTVGHAMATRGGESYQRTVGASMKALALVVEQQRAEKAALLSVLADAQVERANVQRLLGVYMEEKEAAAAEPQPWQTIPLETAQLVTSLGPVEWKHTKPMTPTEIGKEVAASMRLTSDHFQQDYQQPMQWLGLEGTDIVLAYTGTSPQSGHITQALAGAWNWLVGQSHLALLMAGEGQ
ncbi:hypothetical protein [Deinococcus sp. QL22]|uniref:hypothetical protein n=1 Tax=Deinococcus sp. QL22 TaxID=2939437 RepID=UPI0020172DC5|nr:hypothetical protein [Deinococcus sp. QL22]UQN06784.1 hypothetical protein M1R55_02350 [Deinococcus sp. QL22]